MNEAIIKSIYDWNPWLEGPFPKELVGFSRRYQLEEYLQIPEIKIIEGARRVGKSTLLYQIIAKIFEQKQEVLYLNFEDEILRQYTLNEVVSAYYAIRGSPTCLFIDEIQNCREWVSFVRKAHDKKEIPQIWISGSNSSFIRNELGTLLTGRNITIKVYPLSFVEYLNFKSIKNVKLPFSSKQETAVKNHYLQFLEIGAFPAVVLRPILQKELLISYFEDFIYKDIASRHEVNIIKIRELGLYLATNSSKLFSYRGCAQALGMHPKTIGDYCSYFYEIFLFSELYKFDYSLKKQIGSEKKIYINDTGLANAISFRFSEDRGRILETVVYHELRREGHEIYFHKQKYECDFLIKEGLKIQQAIQVAKTLEDPEVKKRELNGLLEAMNIHQLKEGLILTFDDKETVEEVRENGIQKRVIIMPIWKWMIQQDLQELNLYL